MAPLPRRSGDVLRAWADEQEHNGVVGWPARERAARGDPRPGRSPDQRRSRRDRLHQQHDPRHRPDRRRVSLAAGRQRRHGRRGIPLEPLSLDEPGEPGRRRCGWFPAATVGSGSKTWPPRSIDSTRRADDQPRRVRLAVSATTSMRLAELCRATRDRAFRRRDPGARAAHDRRAANADRLPGRRRPQVAARARGGGPALRPPRLDRPAAADRRRLAQRRRLVQFARATTFARSRAPSGGKGARSTCRACLPSAPAWGCFSSSGPGRGFAPDPRPGRRPSASWPPRPAGRSTARPARPTARPSWCSRTPGRRSRRAAAELRRARASSCRAGGDGSASARTSTITTTTSTRLGAGLAGLG